MSPTPAPRLDVPAAAAAIGLAVCLLMCGCDRDDPIQAFDVPKDAPKPVRVAATQPAGPMSMQMPGAGQGLAAPEGTRERVRWTTPDGWREEANPPAPRIASFQVGEGPRAATVTLTVFGGNVGGVHANINRWRGMVGLAPISHLEEQPMQRVTVDGSDAIILDLQGAATPPEVPQRTLAAIVPREGEMWFVRMFGDPQTIGEQTQRFEAFVTSLKIAPLPTRSANASVPGSPGSPGSAAPGGREAQQ